MGRPGDAEVCEVGGAGGGGEEDVGGFDVAVDDAEGVQVGECGEEVVQDGLNGGAGGGFGAREELGEVVWLEGEDEDEAAARLGEGGQEWDCVWVFAGLEDAGFADGVVGCGH